MFLPFGRADRRILRRKAVRSRLAAGGFGLAFAASWVGAYSAGLTASSEVNRLLTGSGGLLAVSLGFGLGAVSPITGGGLSAVERWRLGIGGMSMTAGASFLFVVAFGLL